MDEMKKWLREQMEKTKIPDSLRPEQMEERVNEVKQRRGGFSFQKAGILVAAVLFVAILGAVGRIWLSSGGKTGSMSDLASGGMEMVAENQMASGGEDAKALDSNITYDEIYESITALTKYYGSDLNRNIYYDAVMGEKEKSIAEDADGAVVEEKSAAAPAGNAAFAADGENGEMIMDSSVASEEDYTGTDLQVVGVDEGDRILTDGRYFYTLQGDGYEDECILHIVSVDGKKTEELSHIAFPKFYFQNMYRFQQRIFLIGYRTTEENEDVFDAENPQTVVYVIDISDKEHPKKEYTRKQDGYYTNSRLTGGYLYLFSGYELPRYRLKDYKQSEPSSYVPSVDDEIIPENRLYAPAKKGDGSYTVMTSLDLNHPASFRDRAAIYGHYRNFYMSQEHFYIVQSTFTWLRPWFHYIEEAVEDTDTMDTEETGDSAGTDEEGEDSLITRFSYENGRFLLKAKGKFSGETNGSYAFHEYKGNLCVVYTKYDEKTTNGLYVFDDSLKKIGEIGDLGVDEEIYASYYIDHMAYFVTYRNTDPVFAVDIENPEKPKLCSELKLPGYSDYLHSFGKEYMLGLGVHNDGENFEKERYKLSLFRINADQSLEETERQILPYKSWDYELNNQDHREVFVDEERGLVGFYLHYSEYGNRFEYLLYRKNGDKLEQIWKKTVDVKGKTYYLDELRGFRIGDIFYVVSGSGQIEVYPL